MKIKRRMVSRSAMAVLTILAVAGWLALTLAAEQRVDPDYTFASPAAYERFADLKFGMRIVWGQNMVMGLNWDGALRKGGCSEEFRKIYGAVMGANA